MPYNDQLVTGSKTHGVSFVFQKVFSIYGTFSSRRRAKSNALNYPGAVVLAVDGTCALVRQGPRSQSEDPAHSLQLLGGAASWVGQYAEGDTSTLSN